MDFIFRLFRYQVRETVKTVNSKTKRECKEIKIKNAADLYNSFLSNFLFNKFTKPSHINLIDPFLCISHRGRV